MHVVILHHPNITTMKQRLGRSLLLVALGLGVLAVARPAHAQLGLSAGLNFNEMGDIDTGSRQATLDNATGWHVELWYRLGLGPIGVQPGIRYMDAGNLYEGLQEEGGVDPGDFDIRMVEVPVDVQFNLGLPLISPFVSAGPVMRFPTGLDEEIKDDFKSFSMAGSLGLGARVGLAGIKLIPEIKYTFSISNVTDGFDIGAYSFTTDEGQSMNAVMLRLGIQL